MRIAITGTRGIPNHYGGFEQCAEYLAKGLVKNGYEVVVYNSHNHPYQLKEWNKVNICHCHDPEHKLGTIGQFIYDLNCIRDLRKKHFDVILQLGYTSSSVWGWLLPKNTVVTTNMDGLEWKRSKYSQPVKAFLRYAEKLAVMRSDFLIADSVKIQSYIEEKYGKRPAYIPYGAEIFDSPDISVLRKYNLRSFKYDMLIARMEPENSVEIILDGRVLTETDRQFLVVGSTNNAFGNYLKKKYQGHKKIVFTGGIYDLNILNNLRHFSNVYFHGHTVGGTNPSLLEAMASNSLICANDNVFNRSILGTDSFYFSTAADVSFVLSAIIKNSGVHQSFVKNNLNKIRNIYSCQNIVNAYANHFESIAGTRTAVDNSTIKNPVTVFNSPQLS